jgi:hypothetical protein
MNSKQTAKTNVLKEQSIVGEGLVIKKDQAQGAASQ